MKKRLSFILALAMVVSLVFIAAPASMALLNIVPNPSYDAIPVPIKAVTRIAGNTADAAVDGDYSGVFIDLATEKLVLPATLPAQFGSIAAFNIGGKWKAGSPDDKAILGLLNKGGTLILTNSYDTKTKAPTKGVTFKAESEPGKGDGVEAVVGAITIEFEKIEARPKDTKLAINYGLNGFKDDSGKTNGRWTLTAKGATAFDASKVAGLEILQPADNKKPAEGERYQNFPAGGVGVLNMEDGKPVKTTYYVRSKATTGAKYTPASKGYKVSASSLTKAPSVKVDYKNEVMKLKAPMNVYFGTPASLRETNSTAVIAKTTNGYPAEADKFILISAAKKEDAKVPALLKDYLSADSKSIVVWTGASEKKPASQPLEIKLAKRAAAPTAAIDVNDKGKVSMTKEWEAYDSTKKKYGGFPKLTKQSDVSIRVKNKAKAQKSDGYTIDDSGQVAASWDTIYVAEFGVLNQAAIDEGKAKTPPKTVAAKNGVVKVTSEATVTISGPAAATTEDEVEYTAKAVGFKADPAVTYAWALAANTVTAVPTTQADLATAFDAGTDQVEATNKLDLGALTDGTYVYIVKATGTANNAGANTVVYAGIKIVVTEPVMTEADVLAELNTGNATTIAAVLGNTAKMTLVGVTDLTAYNALGASFKTAVATALAGTTNYTKTSFQSAFAAAVTAQQTAIIQAEVDDAQSKVAAIGSITKDDASVGNIGQARTAMRTALNTAFGTSISGAVYDITVGNVTISLGAASSTDADTSGNGTYTATVTITATGATTKTETMTVVASGA